MNQGYLTDSDEIDEAIQAKALPWRRDEKEQSPKAQEEFPPWINNKDYLPYASPTNTLMGKKKMLFEIQNNNFLKFQVCPSTTLKFLQWLAFFGETAKPQLDQAQDGIPSLKCSTSTASTRLNWKIADKESLWGNFSAEIPKIRAWRTPFPKWTRPQPQKPQIIRDFNTKM